MNALNTLHKLIGLEFRYDNRSCTLIEIIDEGPSMVVQCQDVKTIQVNQHGNAHRKSQPTYTIACLNEFQTDLHPVLKAAVPESEHSQLLSVLLGPGSSD